MWLIQVSQILENVSYLSSALAVNFSFTVTALKRVKTAERGKEYCFQEQAITCFAAKMKRTRVLANLERLKQCI